MRRVDVSGTLNNIQCVINIRKITSRKKEMRRVDVYGTLKELQNLARNNARVS